ncbi:MAG: hypothetical protein WCA35_00175 [Kovacikia sp.]
MNLSSMKLVSLRFRIKSLLSSLSLQIRRHFIDILITFAFVTFGGVASYLGAQLIAPVILKLYDVWFDSDTGRVFDQMTSATNLSRLSVHPLFVLIAFPPVKLLEKVLHLNPITSVRIVIAAVAAFWLGTLFTTLRLLGCQRFDAILFSLLGATSASAIFWFTVPETYSFGSLSILLALCFAALTENRLLSPLWYVAVSALTLSITTTNWMFGILVTSVNHRWKQSIQITLNALVVVTLLWVVQKYKLTGSVFFLGEHGEGKYIMVFKSAADYLTVVKSFFSNTLVMPAIQLTESIELPEWPAMNTQSADPGSGSMWGLIAVGLWMALLGLGMWGFFSIKKHTKFRLVLGFSLLGQGYQFKPGQVV